MSKHKPAIKKNYRKCLSGTILKNIIQKILYKLL